MIVSTGGNILESKADVLVNPVNCKGIMGAGLAKQFKNKFPEYFKYYKKLCEFGEIQIGFVHFYKHGVNPKYIVSFPTKVKPSDKMSNYHYIRQGLVDFDYKLNHINHMIHPPISSIAIPKIGCGLGGLEWAKVRAMILKTFMNNEKLDIYLFET